MLRFFLLLLCLQLWGCAQTPATTVPAADVTAPAAVPNQSGAAPAGTPSAEAPGATSPGAQPAPTEPAATAIPLGPAPDQPAAATTPAPAQDARLKDAVVALVVPAQSTPFALAADALRQGFFDAHAAAGAPFTIQVLEIDDTPAKAHGLLATARDRGVRLAVGPLPRGQVNALVESGNVPVPTLALNVPDREAGAPPNLLAFGLSVELEARYVVQTVLGKVDRTRAASSLTPSYLILAGATPLARRTAVAFRDALREHGERATQIDVSTRLQDLQALQAELAGSVFEAVFLALDAREAAIVRPRLPREWTALYGTSRIYLAGAAAEVVAGDLEGVRFVDMPWLLEPDHPAVAVYKRPILDGVAMSAELQRLYALGIDAHRIAEAWLREGLRLDFGISLDGVTGWLRIDRAKSVRVERLPSFAVFRGGRVERVDAPQ